MENLLAWDVYEVKSSAGPLVGMKLRGTLRKFALEQSVNLLTENASDAENTVRFALLACGDVTPFTAMLTAFVPQSTVTCIHTNVKNPVLSKLRVNDAERYESII